MTRMRAPWGGLSVGVHGRENQGLLNEQAGLNRPQVNVWAGGDDFLQASGFLQGDTGPQEGWGTNGVNTEMDRKVCSRGRDPARWAPGWPGAHPAVGSLLHCPLLPAFSCWAPRCGTLPDTLPPRPPPFLPWFTL